MILRSGRYPNMLIQMRSLCAQLKFVRAVRLSVIKLKWWTAWPAHQRQRYKQCLLACSAAVHRCRRSGRQDTQLQHAQQRLQEELAQYPEALDNTLDLSQTKPQEPQTDSECIRSVLRCVTDLQVQVERLNGRLMRVERLARASAGSKATEVY